MKRIIWPLLFTASLSAQTVIGVAAGHAGSNGTVTSVSLSAPAQFSVVGSPVTTIGTLALSWASATQNTIFAAPCASNGTPVFRLLCAADIPALAPSKITGTAVIDSDSRLTNSRTPTAHASTHAAAGSDPIAISPSQVTGTAVVTADARLSDARTPTAHASTHASAGSDPITIAESQVTNLTSDLAGKQAADSDLSDLASAGSNGTGAFQRATGNVATATNLAANPTDCSAGQFANAIAASGNLTCGSEVGDVTTTTAQIVTGEKYLSAAQTINSEQWRSTFFVQKQAYNATTLIAVGGGSAAVSGTASSLNDSTGSYNNYASAASIGAAYGLHVSNFAEAEGVVGYTVAFKTGTDITNIECHFGPSVSNFGTLPSPVVSSAMVVYDTSLDGTAFWRVEHNDASGSPTRFTTTAPIAADTRYTVRVIADSLTNYRFYVNDALVYTATSDLPAATVQFEYVAKCHALEAVAKSIRFGRIYGSRN